MANHARVKTKKKMTAENVTAVLNSLNERIFKGKFSVEYSCEDGDHIWSITYENYVHRICWLNTSRHFEIRHGCRGQFDWWADFAITNEIAVIFNGTITDDGGGKIESYPSRFDSFQDYLTGLYSNSRPEVKDYLFQLEMEMVPEEFKH